jgi:hypothetical protein
MSGDIQISIDEGDPIARSSKDKAPDARVSSAAVERAVIDGAHAAEYWRRRAENAEQVATDNAINAAKAEADASERDYQAAFEAGDSAKLADAQRKIARAETKVLRFEEAAASIDAQRRSSSRAVTDPVEAVAQTRSPKSAAWIRQHPDWILDQSKNQRLTAGHYDAMGEGLTPDTPEYFEHVERFIGLREGASARSHPQNSTMLEDGAAVLKVKPGDPLPPGAVKLSKREFELATEVLTWETGPKRGQPLGVREYLRRRQLQQGPEWQRSE